MLSEKFIKKYMGMAKFIAEDQPVCYSRHIGGVLVDPIRNIPLSTGYNGPPKNTPHCDSEEYLREIFWPQLSNEDKQKAADYIFDFDTDAKYISAEIFASHAKNCGVCPRKLINAGAGEKSNLCSCIHCEENVILNSTESNISGSYLFMYSDVGPCFDCSKRIVQKGISRIYYNDGVPEYNKMSAKILAWGKVEVIRVKI